MVLGERASRPVRASRRGRKSRIHTWRSPFGDLERTTRTCREDHVDDTGHGSCDTANRAPTHRGCNRVQLISGVAGAADEDDDRCDGCALAVAAGLSAASGARCSQTRPRSCCRRAPNPAVGRGGSPTERSEGGSPTERSEGGSTGCGHDDTGRHDSFPFGFPVRSRRTRCSTASQSVTSWLGCPGRARASEGGRRRAARGDGRRSGAVAGTRDRGCAGGRDVGAVMAVARGERHGHRARGHDGSRAPRCGMRRGAAGRACAVL